MSKSRFTAIAFLGLAFSSLVLPAQDGSAPFSFTDPAVRIPVGASDGYGEITLTLRPKADSSPAGVPADIDLPHPTTATVVFEKVEDPTSTKGSWRFRVHVSGLLPANASEQHYALVIYDKDKKQYIPFLVTNAASNFAWSLSKPADPWVDSGWWSDQSCSQFTVTPKGSPATGLFLNSGMVEQNTKHTFADGHVFLCVAGDDACNRNTPINLPANVPTPLRICVSKTFAGNFHGAVTLSSLQKPDGDTILQNASFSTIQFKCLGVLILCTGVALAWWSKIWARARLQRDQALLPAVLMQEQVTKLQEAVANLGATYAPAPIHAIAAMTLLQSELSAQTLDANKFLPPKFPMPYGFAADLAAYKAYLDTRTQQILLLSVLIRKGFIPAKAEDGGGLTPAQQTLIVTAIQDIDCLWLFAPQYTPDQAFNLIQPILTNLSANLHPAAPPAGPQAPQPLPASPTESLRVEMDRISGGVWLIYGVLTVLSGLAVLILNNPGFGIPIDFIFAFFWGFGMPTTISALTPGSVNSALNISVPAS